MRVLEPRILLDAAAVETAQDMAFEAVQEDAAEDAAGTLAAFGDPDAPLDGSTRDLSRDIVFIDGDIENIGELLGELDPDVEVHILDLQSDGVEQIADVLDGREDILAVHIFSHGGQGFLNLGSAQLSNETIATTHADALSRIGGALGADGDILVYGCDFASGEVGKVVAKQLANATGADIAASNDLTGAAEHGGDWDLEIVEGDIEAKTIQASGFKGVLGAFELGTVDPPTVSYVNEFTPAGAPELGAVGEAGTVAIWENAGTVDTGSGLVSVDVRATVVSVTNAAEIFVGFGTRDDDDGDFDDPTLDDFRVYVHNTSAVAGGSNTGNIGSATIVWEIFETGTGQTIRADIGEVSLTTADIDGVGAGPATTRETLAAALSDLSSYTVQSGTNLEVNNDGVNLRVTGTADQNSEESSWVQYSWNSVNQLTMIYETRTPYAYYNHDGDGDLVFSTPDTSFATVLDLDDDDSSGSSGSDYQTIFYSNATSGSPVAIADGDVVVTNEIGSATSATITLNNAMAGDLLNVQSSILSSLGLTGTVDTSVSGVITVTLSGEASTTDYHTALQSITFESTNYGSINPTPRSIDVQVFDGAFASGIANTSITFGTIVNQPTANHDVYVGQEDTTLSVAAAEGLLANDSDPNGVAISILSATDSNGDAITINPVAAPSPVTHTTPTGAVLTLFDDGTFTYAPVADYSGVEFFNYTVENTNGFIGQSYAAINIQGVADLATVPAGLVSSGADEDSNSASLDITATQGDADGSESLRYSISQIPAGYSVTDGTRSFTSSGTGDVAFLDGWDLTTISLVPPDPDQHSDGDINVELTVEATEPNGSSASTSEVVTFRFDAVADAPILTTSDGSAGPNALLNISPLVSATLTDIDGSEEIVSYSFSNIPIGATFYIGASAQTPIGGVVVVAAADLPGLRLETPAVLGAYTVDVMATASESNAENQVALLSANSTVETLSFTVDNIDDPVIAADDAYTVFGGQTLILNPLGNDIVADGGAQITEINGTSITSGQTIALVSGAGDVTLNADGTLTFVADAGFSGQDVVIYTVEDVDGSSDSATITLDAPTWTIVGDVSVAEGSPASYTITLDATPPMGSPVSVDISAINIDTDVADYGDLATAIQLAADASSNFSFDGTTLTFTADYDSTSVAGSNFQDISSDPSATALGIRIFDPTQVSLGFDFDFYGESYADVHVSDFGILTFGAGSPGGGAAYNNTSFAAGNTLGGLPAIAPFWDVLGMDRLNSDDVYTLTQGVPGEREFIVQYNDVVIYFDDTAGQTITFQAVLREGSNEIEFRYDDVSLSNSTYSLGNSATVGVSDGSGTRFEEFSFASTGLSDNSRIVFSADNTASQSLTFSLAANADDSSENSEDFQIALSNASGASVSSLADSVTTSITDTNSAPVNVVPVTGGSAIPATTIAEDTQLVFNAANGNSITVDDPDGDFLTVTLSVTNGTLAAASGSGATIGGDGTASLTLTGTQAQVNAALEGLSYQGVADFNGTDLLTISTDDNGGQANSVVVDTVDLEITAVDDIVKDHAPIVSGNSVTIDVLGNDSFEGSVSDLVAIDGALGTVVVNGDNTITYTWTDAANSGLDSFTYTVTSGGVTETTDVVIIKQGPVLPTDDVASTDEDSVLNVAATGVLANDIGSVGTPTLEYSIIDVSGAPAGSWSAGTPGQVLTWSGGITHNTGPSTAFPGITESLVFDGSGGASGTSLQTLSGNPTDNDASFEIWFKYDPADYGSGQGAIVYETGGRSDGMSIALSDSTGSGSGVIDHLLVQFNDSGNTIVQLIDLEDVLGAGNIGNEFINVTAVYDKNASGTDDEVRLYVNGMLLAVQSASALNDWAGGSGSGLGTNANSANIGSVNFGHFSGEIAKFNFFESALSDEEVKNGFDLVAGLTVVANDATSVLGASVIVNADGSYSYDPTGAAAIQAMQAGDSLNDSFTYTISDANGTLSSATVNITVAGINDAPSGTNVTITISEDTFHTLTVANFGFDDPVDGTNDAFQDVIFTTVPADGDLIYDNGVDTPSIVGTGQTISAADIASGFVTFVPDPDANNSSTTGGSYTSFQFQVVDDGGVADGGVDTDQSPNTFTFAVTPVDDVVSHILPGSQSAVEDTALSIGGVSIVDVDGDGLTSVVSIPAASGSLSVTTGTGAGIVGNGSSSVTLTGTAVQINAALAGLTYTPFDDFNTDAGGPFDLTITTDDGGAPVFDTVSIAVNAVVDITADSVTTLEDTAITFDAIGGTNGASADNFEDASAFVSAVGSAGNGTVSINGSGEIVYTPDANFNGNDTFTYTVTSGGVTETINVGVTINPVNDGPGLVADVASGDEDAGDVVGDVLDNDSDIDGDSLSIVSFTVSGLAGTHSADDSVTIPDVGEITILASGGFSFSPAPDYNGSVPQITYTATDGTVNASSTLDITIDPVNDNPVAVMDSNSTAEDTPLIVNAAAGVLSNDHDGDGGALGVDVSVTGFDVGGSFYTAGATASLAEGDLTLNGDGSYSFIPAANFNGPVPQVTYTVEDTGGLTATAILDINVTPVNDAPVASDDTYVVLEDSLAGVSGNLLLGNSGIGVDSDVDGDALAITSAVVDIDGSGTPDLLTLGIPVTLSDNLFNPIGTLVVEAGGQFNFTPAADYWGPVPPISYIVDDGSGETNSSDIAVLTIAVVAVNDAPDSIVEAVVGNEDQALVLNPTLPVDVDDAQTVLTVLVNQVPQLGQGSLNYVLDSGGTGQVLPGLVMSMTELASVNFLPASNYNGPVDSFVYRAMDDEGETDTGSIGIVAISLLPVNDAPVANDDGPIAITEDMSASGSVLLDDADIDGDPIEVMNFTISGLPGVTPAGSTATIPGVGTLLIGVNGDFLFTPLANYNGPVPAATYTITDGNGMYDSAQLTFDDVVAVNDDPVALPNNYNTPEDTQLTGNLLLDDTGLSADFDIDGDGLSITEFTIAGEPGSFAVGAPVNLFGIGDLTIQADGQFTFDPASNFNGTVPQIIYFVSDGQGGSANAAADIFVDAVNDAPTATSLASVTLEDQIATGQIVINDVDGDVPVAALDTGASNGSVVVNSDGSWSYTPLADFNGVDQFEVIVDDLNGATVSVTVNVTVTPVVDIAGDQLITAEDTPISVNVISGSGTVGGLGGSGVDTFEGAAIVTGVTQGAHGSVVFSAAGDLTYTPDADYHGADSFTYTIVSGGVSETATVTVNVTSVNDAPEASSSPATTAEDTPVSGIIAMSDRDGDPLTASHGDDPDHGSVSVNSDGSWTYTPDPNFAGSDTFTLTIADNNGGITSVLVEVIVVPVNDAPDAYSSEVEVIGTDPVALNLSVPSDIDDAVTVLRSSIIQIPDPALGILTYLPGGLSGSQVPVAVGMQLTNVELATLEYVALSTLPGPAGSLVFEARDDNGASDSGSIASIDIVIGLSPSNWIGPAVSNPLPEPVEVEDFAVTEPVIPLVVDAVNDIANLESAGEFDPENGIILDTVNHIADINSTEAIVTVDPAVLEAVDAIDALRQVHRENSGIGSEERIVSQNNWDVEGITGFSLKFAHDDRQEEEDVDYSEVGQLIIETYVRERILFIDVSNTFDPDTDGTVIGYRVEMADGSELPDWIRIVRDGFIVAERPANLWDLDLKISAELEDGTLITRGVLIDGPTGEIQQLEVGGQEDGKRFEDQLRMMIKS